MVASAYPTAPSMQLHATCTRPCIPLEVVTGISKGQYNLKWESHQLRWGWPKEDMHKVPYPDTSLQTCLVGPWEGMLEVNW